jgi:uncharacterized membrane protein
VTVDWQKLGYSVAFGSIGLVVLRLVIRSLRTGINDWAAGGPYKRAPGKYDFWIVTLIFAIVASAWVLVSAFILLEALA